MKKEWFATWFDSPYYHLLYKSHDENEAKSALDNLLRALQLSPESKILDLACGKGRHSKYLAEKGFQVTGIDISTASIAYARSFERPGLEFYQHDMRLPFRINYFEAIINLFTSFGYFQNDADHLRTLKHVAKGLKPGGKFLLDFFNSVYVRENLVRSEIKTVGEINYSLKRWTRGGYVFKNIEFYTAGRRFEYQEKVRLFELEDFQLLFQSAGLRLIQTYGGYDLGEFERKNSKRLILLAEKP